MCVLKAHLVTLRNTPRISGSLMYTFSVFTLIIIFSFNKQMYFLLKINSFWIPLFRINYLDFTN